MKKKQSRLKKNKSNIYVFFDLDYTLLPYDTLLMFCNYVLKRKPWRIFYLCFFLPILPLALFGLIDLGGLKRVFLSFLWKLSGKEVEELSRNFVFDEVIPAVYPELKKILNNHKKLKHRTILNTASAAFYVKYIAEMLGFDAYCATDIKTAKVMPLFPLLNGKNNKNYEKLRAMSKLLPARVQLRLSRPQNYDGSFKLARSYAYSDSAADLPMLRLAENVTLIHPRSSSLLQEAREKNWNILQPERPYRQNFHFFINLKQAFGLN